MLQHNISAGRHAHVAHAAVLSLHMFCCGIPTLAVTLGALTGFAASGTLAASGLFGAVHRAIHGHELWILAVSAALVSVGGLMEMFARRRRRLPFPWLFTMSLCCFCANLAIIVVHRGL
jgi:hypothetical protein